MVKPTPIRHLEKRGPYDKSGRPQQLKVTLMSDDTIVIECHYEKKGTMKFSSQGARTMAKTIIEVLGE